MMLKRKISKMFLPFKNHLIKSKKETSLQKQLSVSILLLTLIVAIISGVVAGWSALQEAKETQDELLNQVARLLPHDTNKSDKFFYTDDDDVQIFVRNLTNYNHQDEALFINPDAADGYYDIKGFNGPWRALVISLDLNDGNNIKYVVAQRTEERNEIALDNMFSAMLPISVFSVLLLIFLFYQLNKIFLPVKAQANAIKNRDKRDLTPVDDEQLTLELKPFVASINFLLSKAQTNLYEQKRFISDAAHELRTPVTSLTLMVENIQNTNDQKQRSERLIILQQGLERLKILIEQLLSLARSKEDIKEHRETVLLNPIVENILVDFHPLAENKNIDIGVKRFEQITLNDINHSLKIILQNAISNAINYTPDDGIIDVELYQQQGFSFFKVSDSGPGIADNELAKVFKPFYRLANKDIPGNGLGLAICEELANKLGGEVMLQRSAYDGLSFIYKQKSA